MVWGRLGAGFALIGVLCVAIALLAVAEATAVTDATAPALTLPSASTTNATSPRGATVSFIAVATDDVQPTSISCTPASGSRFPIGTTNVTCSALDAAGHTASASFAITVLGAADQLLQLRNAVIAAKFERKRQSDLLDELDAAKRALDRDKQKQACKNLDDFADALRDRGRSGETGQSGLTTQEGDETRSGQSAESRARPTSAVVSDLVSRANAVQAALDCIASDAPPVLLGPRADISAKTAPDASTATIRFTGPSSAVTCAPTSPATLGVGTTKVTCTATNSAGSTKASFLVTVADMQAPVLTLPSDIGVTAPPGSSSAVVTYVVSAVDNVGIRSTVCAPASGSSFPRGLTTVSCTATDTSGNTATGTFKVTVNVAISGRITDRATGLPIAGVAAALFDASSNLRVGLTTSGSDGTYSIVVGPGTYRAFFNGDLAKPYTREWWNHKADVGDDIVVSGSVGGIDAALTAGVVVHGRVTDESTGSGIANVSVSAVDPAVPCCRSISNASTDASGDYQLIVPSGAVVKVQFTAGSSPRYMVEWWNNKRNFGDANPLTVTGETFGTDAALTPAVLLSGRVTDEQSGAAIGSIAVVVTDSTTPCCPFGGITVAVTTGDGAYSVLVPKGRPIKIQFLSLGSADPQYIGEWFDNQPDWDHAAIRSFTTDTAGIDAALTKGAFIRGHVTRLDNGAPIERIHVNVNDGLAPCCQFVVGTRTDSNGDYAVLIRPGTYKVVFYSDVADPPADGHVYLEQWWQGVRFFESATAIVVAGDTPGINARLTQGVIIRGRVTDSTGTVPVVGMNVSAQVANQPCCQFVSGTQTDGLGNYLMLVPQGANVKVEFGVFGGPPPGTHYLGEWWSDKSSFDTADAIVADIDRNGVDARLASGFFVSGNVSDAAGQPLAGVVVNADDAAMPCCTFVAGAQTDALGNYRMVLPAGSRVRVFFIDPAHPRLMPQWWNNKPFFDGADIVDVTGDLSGIDARLRLGVLISGRVTDATGTSPVSGLNVSAQDASLACCRFVGGTQTDALGNYTLFVPLGASVKVEFGVFSGSPAGTHYIGEWWNDKSSFETAIVLSASADLSGIDARLDAGFLISGTVRGPSGPLANVFVGANLGGPAPCCTNLGGANTDATGHYQLTLRAGTYRINVSAPPSRHIVMQWWNGVPGGTADFNRATDIILGPSDAPGRDFDVVLGTIIEGRVTDTAGVPLGGIGISANDANIACCETLASTQSDGAGNYAMVVPFGRQVRVFFGPNPSSPYSPQWWNNKPTFGLADVINATTDRSGIDARLGSGGPFVVSGHVSERGTGIALAGIHIQAFDAGVPCCPPSVGETGSDAFGNYALTLPAGRYKLVFYQFPLGDHPHYVQWWHDRTFDFEGDVLVVSGPTPGIDQELPIAVWISGRVTDATGTIPVVGLDVSAQNSAFVCCRFVDGAQTDAGGNYRFIAPIGTGLKIQFGVFGPPGAYVGQWWNDKPTFDTADVLLANADRSGIDARLATASAVSISGHVTDRATGVPIESIDVTAFDALVPCCARLGSARTNATGDYTLTLPGGASVKLVFESSDPGPAYVQRWWQDKFDFGPADQIVVNGAATNIDQALDAGYRIRGRVTDSTNPAIGVSFVSVTAQPNFSCCFYGTSTQPDGRYSLVVGAGTYRISFFAPYGSDFLEQWWNGKPGYAAADLLTVPSSSIDLSAIDAALVHGIPVHGRVTDAGGLVGVERVGVVATLDDPAVPCCVNYFAQTDAVGNYLLYLRPGRYRINFQPPNTTDYVLEYWDDQPDFASATLLDVTGPTFNINAALARGFHIRGRVTDATGGAGVSGATVQIISLPCCGPSIVQQTALDGTYNAVVRAGNYKVSFNPPFGSDFVGQYWNGKLDFNSADTLVVVDTDQPNIDGVLAHGVRLSGRVTEATDATRGIAGVNVSASTSPGLQFVANTATMADGTYSLFVVPGTYILSFNPPFGSDFLLEYWNDKADVATADPINVTGPMVNLDAGLARGLNINGRLTDEAGAPIPGIFVNIFRSELPFTFVTAQVTDADGRYSMKVHPGSYKVFFGSGVGVPFISEWWRDKFTFETADVIVASSPGAIADGVLTRGVLISGRVTASGSGAALGGATVYVYDATQPCCVNIAAAGTGSDGAYSFALAPGSYWVSFFAIGYTQQWWNAKTSSLTADILSGAVDHLNVNAAMVPTGP